ncbi:unnamed protein product [Blepharisma stoltei]|uniref:Uncharacterized protein n=1 Tax=Blepharisma stoltei TaxID=1481888 RepID=A0AAU9I8A1_9CILI|nr:unnamed protein product [Blepharisma stoltei]
MNFLRLIYFSGSMHDIMFLIVLSYTILFIIGTLAFLGQIFNWSFLSSLISLLVFEMKVSLSIVFLLFSSEVTTSIRSMSYNIFKSWKARQDNGPKYIEKALLFLWLYAIAILNIYLLWKMNQLFLELFEEKTWILKEGFYLELATTFEIWLCYPETIEESNYNSVFGIYTFMRLGALLISQSPF